MEDADAAVIEQVDAARLTVLGEDGVVAEMGIAVDHRGAAEGVPPGLEHRMSQAVAHLERPTGEGQDLLALEPALREQAPGREFGVDDRDPHRLDALKHVGIEGGVPRLAGVIEFFPHPVADLLGDLAGVDHRADAPVQGEGDLELLQVRLDGGFHVRILQLAGEGCAVQRLGPMDLA